MELPNFTLLIQLIIILSLMAVLSHFLFKPFLNILQERKERVERAEKKAKELRERAEELMERYRESMAQAQARGAEIREGIRKESLAQELDILHKAVEEANQSISEIKAKIAQETGTAKAGLRLQAQAISREIAAKVLGRSLS